MTQTLRSAELLQAASLLLDLKKSTLTSLHACPHSPSFFFVHLFLKRALGLTFAWGDPAFHRARISERLFGFAAGPDTLFERTFDQKAA